MRSRYEKGPVLARLRFRVIVLILRIALFLTRVRIAVLRVERSWRNFREMLPRPYGQRMWVRRTWCLLLHWRSYYYISASECSAGAVRIRWPFTPSDNVGSAVVRETECIRHWGCYQCQLVWYRKKWSRYDVTVD